jgi:FixJ family two-component response regulator
METSRTRHVVFVDDEPKVCDVVQKTLERVGMNVQCFLGADDCLVHLAVERCDLLITDVKMPGKDGIELLNEAKRRLPWLPVVVVTGYGDVPMAVRALKAGAADFVEKPLDRDGFLGTIEALLERHAGQASLCDLCLTKSEMKVLYLILEGRNNREIATALHRSPRTIEVHRGHLMRKMGASNTVEMLRRAVDMGLFRSGSLPRGEAITQKQRRKS